MPLRFSTSARTARAAALNTEIGAAAILRVYSGAQPASVATGASGVLLAELVCGSPFGSASGGVLTANAITQDSAANASGTAGWCRVFKADGTTAVIDGTVTAQGGGGQLELVTTSIVAGQPVIVSSFVVTEGNA